MSSFITPISATISFFFRPCTSSRHHHHHHRRVLSRGTNSPYRTVKQLDSVSQSQGDISGTIPAIPAIPANSTTTLSPYDSSRLFFTRSPTTTTTTTTTFTSTSSTCETTITISPPSEIPTTKSPILEIQRIAPTNLLDALPLNPISPPSPTHNRLSLPPSITSPSPTSSRPPVTPGINLSFSFSPSPNPHPELSNWQNSLQAEGFGFKAWGSLGGITGDEEPVIVTPLAPAAKRPSHGGVDEGAEEMEWERERERQERKRDMGREQGHRRTLTTSIA